jgi:hypothetical protein
MSESANQNNTIHNETVISQFTKQAVPFAQLSQHSNQYGLELMIKLSQPKNNYIIIAIDNTGIKVTNTDQ